MRKIIKIDESKCDGCGICADACHEGAISIVDGKARLVSESYCDGLGDCLGECPCGAISFEEREAAGYDEAAVKERLVALGRESARGKEANMPCGCPGSMAKSLNPKAGARRADSPVMSPGAARGESSLRNWPVQLTLVPERAPYLQNAVLLIAADCTAFACPAFHSDLLPGRVCLVGCPKLDDIASYRAKIARIVKQNGIRSVDVAYMEVPCCNGLLNVVKAAIDDAGAPIPVRRIRIGLEGEVLECEWQ